ncbi:MAG: hypothetical protein GY938_06235 [Ketobacter sp.]|nr:hypothetical protein [Ketobacter sp.]
MTALEVEISSDDKEIIDICQLYWVLDDEGKFSHAVYDIAEETNFIPNHITNIARQYSQASSPAYARTSCTTRFYFKTRNEYMQRSRYKNIQCESCLSKVKEQRRVEKIVAINQLNFERQLNEFNPDNASLKDCVYLLSLIRWAGADNLEYIEPYFAHRATKLSPSFELDIDIIEGLYDSGFLGISTYSDLNQINLEDDGSTSFHLGRVCLTPLFNSKNTNLVDLIKTIEEKLTHPNEWSHEWKSELIELCVLVSVEECLAFLSLMLEERNFPEKRGKKTKASIEKALTKYSVSQVYCFIYVAAINASDYYRKYSPSPDRASNTVCGKITRLYENAIAEDKAVKSFERNFKLPQPEISQLIFNCIMKTNDGGFKKNLSELLACFLHEATNQEAEDSGFNDTASNK